MFHWQPPGNCPLIKTWAVEENDLLPLPMETIEKEEEEGWFIESTEKYLRDNARHLNP